LIAVLFKFFFILLGWILSFALVLLSLGVVLAAFAAVFAIPWMASRHTIFHDRSGHDWRKPQSIVESYINGSSSESYDDLEATYTKTYVGPNGSRVEIRTADRAAWTEIATEQRQHVARVRAVAEIDDEDAVWDNSTESEAASSSSECDGTGAANAEGCEDNLATDEELTGLMALSSGSSSTNGGAMARPDWVDGESISVGSNGVLRVRAECGPCESKPACDVAFRDAVDSVIKDYVRGRADTVLADLKTSVFPWQENFIRRTAERLDLKPSDSFVYEHDMTPIGEVTSRTYFKYGLIEFPPGLRDGIDREIISWARSFQVGMLWVVLLGAVASAYLLLKVSLARWLRNGPRWKRITLATGAAILVASFFGAALHML
jgi:hypothetical protein